MPVSPRGPQPARPRPYPTRQQDNAVVPKIRPKFATMSQADVDTAIKDKAALCFGLNNVKPQQLDAIRACLRDKDTLITLPTGFGKSLCFQLIPALTGGTVIVICPLLALAADQVYTYPHVSSAPGWRILT